MKSGEERAESGEVKGTEKSGRQAEQGREEETDVSAAESEAGDVPDG